jgi:hypothetical protein
MEKVIDELHAIMKDDKEQKYNIKDFKREPKQYSTNLNQSENLDDRVDTSGSTGSRNPYSPNFKKTAGKLFNDFK